MRSRPLKPSRICPLAMLGVMPLVVSGCVLRKAISEIYVAQHLNAGIQAVLKHKGEKAVAELERVLEVEPNHREAQAFIGRAYAQAKQYEKALPLLEKQPARQRRLEDWFQLADAYDQIGRYDDAEAAYRHVLSRARTSDEMALGCNNLGYMLANRDRHLDEALRLIQEADRRLPNQGFIIDSLAWVHHKRGDHEAAIHAIDRACELSPAHAELHYHRGMILLALAKKEDAIDAFGRALETDPDNDGAHQELVKLKVDPKRYTAKQPTGWRKQLRDKRRALEELGRVLRRGRF